MWELEKPYSGRHFLQALCLMLFLGPEGNKPSAGHMEIPKFLGHPSPNLLNWTGLKRLSHEQLELIKHCLVSLRLLPLRGTMWQACHFVESLP